jgi:membrane glycosyltransferase
MTAIPLAIWLGSNKSGLRVGLFLTPTEVEPPTVMTDLEDQLAAVKGRGEVSVDIEKAYGIMQVCLDPYVNGLHVSLLRRRRTTSVSRDYMEDIKRRFVQQGPHSLKRQELNVLMNDSESVSSLHYELWSTSGKQLAPFWSKAISQYNLSQVSPFKHLLAQPEGKEQHEAGEG